MLIILLYTFRIMLLTFHAYLDTNMTITPEQSIISETNTVVDLKRDDEEELAGFSSSVAQIREETKLVEKMVNEIKSVKETIKYIQEPDEKVEQVVEVVGKITEKIDKLENIIDDLVKRLTASASSGYFSKETETTDTETDHAETIESETQTCSSTLNIHPSFEIRHLQTSCDEQLKTLVQIKSESNKQITNLKDVSGIKNTTENVTTKRIQRNTASGIVYILALACYIECLFLKTFYFRSILTIHKYSDIV